MNMIYIFTYNTLILYPSIVAIYALLFA